MNVTLSVKHLCRPARQGWFGHEKGMFWLCSLFKKWFNLGCPHREDQTQLPIFHKGNPRVCSHFPKISVPNYLAHWGYCPKNPLWFTRVSLDFDTNKFQSLGWPGRYSKQMHLSTPVGSSETSSVTGEGRERHSSPLAWAATNVWLLAQLSWALC